jgi:hypothetical protein
VGPAWKVRLRTKKGPGRLDRWWRTVSCVSFGYRRLAVYALPNTSSTHLAAASVADAKLLYPRCCIRYAAGPYCNLTVVAAARTLRKRLQQSDSIEADGPPRYSTLQRAAAAKPLQPSAARLPLPGLTLARAKAASRLLKDRAGARSRLRSARCHRCGLTRGCHASADSLRTQSEVYSQK